MLEKRKPPSVVQQKISRGVAKPERSAKCFFCWISNHCRIIHLLVTRPFTFHLRGKQCAGARASADVAQMRISSANLTPKSRNFKNVLLVSWKWWRYSERYCKLIWVAFKSDHKRFEIESELGSKLISLGSKLSKHDDVKRRFIMMPLIYNNW